MSKIAPLDGVGWLAGETDGFRAWVAEVSRWRVFAAGQLIYSAEDRSDGIYGLGSGCLELSFPLVSDEPIFLHLAEIGFWIGDTAEMTGLPRMVSLTAATQSRLLHIPSAAVQQFLRTHPDGWRSFYRLGALNLHATLTHYSEALALSVRARVCRHLLRLSKASDSVEVTQHDLARMIGIARSTLRHCLSDLAAKGAISGGYRTVRVSDPAVLAAFVNEP